VDAGLDRDVQALVSVIDLQVLLPGVVASLRLAGMAANDAALLSDLNDASDIVDRVCALSGKLPASDHQDCGARCYRVCRRQPPSLVAGR
jgi:hypothetical protein